MKYIRLMIAAFSLFIGMTALVPSMALADSKSTVCQTLGSDATCGKAVAGSVSLDSIIKVIITVLSAIIGVVSVIMIMVGGFKYVTSNGDANNIKAARSTITYAVVGLVVVAFAQILVKYVLAKVTGNK